MHVHNLRLGFATNSSSSHSIIVLERPLLAQEQHDYDALTYFGRERFVLTTAYDKTVYFVNLLMAAFLRQGLSLAAAQAVMHDWFPHVALDHLHGDIDHQSVLAWPDLLSAPGPFLKDLEAYMQRPDVVVLGGSDEDEEALTHPVPSTPSVLQNLPHERDALMRLRKDGNTWVLFSATNGTKTRFSADQTPYTKSTRPELVDIKITNYCPYACAFCYQSSTKEGVHASLEDLTRIIDQLAQLEVFEVAMGGGEPTEHPDLVQILKHCTQVGIIPNLTTFSTKWLKNEEILETIKHHVGGIGVSVHSLKDLGKVKKIDEALGYDRRVQVLAQHVLGTLSLEETCALITAARKTWKPLLLLGYKRVGFGEQGPAFDLTSIEAQTQLAQVINSGYGSSLSVDTAVANDMPDFVRLVQSANFLVTAEEGMFSTYIDATTNTMAVSSYTTTYHPLPSSAPEIEALYQHLQG